MQLATTCLRGLLTLPDAVRALVVDPATGETRCFEGDLRADLDLTTRPAIAYKISSEGDNNLYQLRTAMVECWAEQSADAYAVYSAIQDGIFGEDPMDGFAVPGMRRVGASVVCGIATQGTEEWSIDERDNAHCVRFKMQFAVGL